MKRTRRLPLSQYGASILAYRAKNSEQLAEKHDFIALTLPVGETLRAYEATGTDHPRRLVQAVCARAAKSADRRLVGTAPPIAGGRCARGP